MAKRLTDIDKWTKNKWFRKLQKKHKLFWLFICDSCDAVGVWEEDLEFAGLLLGDEYETEETLKVFTKQIKVINGGEKWWLVGFCNFQYGELKEENVHNKPHQCYIKMLKQHRLWIDYTKSIDRHKEKDKETDKEKDKETDKEKEEDKDKIKSVFSFSEILNKYPNRDGTKLAKKHFIASVKTEQDWQDINKAMENYLNSERVKKGYVKNASTWFNNWKDWVDYEEPKPEGVTRGKINKDGKYGHLYKEV